MNVVDNQRLKFNIKQIVVTCMLFEVKIKKKKKNHFVMFIYLLYYKKDFHGKPKKKKAISKDIKFKRVIIAAIIQVMGT